MNYYKTAERFLYNYNSLEAAKKNMQSELEEMDSNIAVAGISFSEKVAKTYSFSSSTENEAISISEKKKILKIRIESLTKKLERVDRAIDSTDDTEKEIIRLRYLQGKQWWEIAYELKFSERHCKRVRTNGIEKVAIALFGEDVLFMSPFNKNKVI